MSLAGVRTQQGTFGWTAMKFQMNPYDFDDPLTLHLLSPAGQTF